MYRQCRIKQRLICCIHSSSLLKILNLIIIKTNRFAKVV
nr:MAG TPA: hypothetical protein [Bacteriophage sp.]